MKKTLIFSLFVAILFTTSCKKENTTTENESKNEIQDGVSVNSKGYLVFQSSKALIEFGKKLNSKKSDHTLADLQEKGFKNRSMKSSLLQARNSNSIYSLIFNEDGLLQVDDIILKITDDDKFLYTLKEEFSNPETYNKLVNEIYDSNKMNKINVDRSLEIDFDLVEYTDENPFGEFENLYGAQQNRPMFGTKDKEIDQPDPAFYNPLGQCKQCTQHYVQTVTYIFWIAFPGEPQFIGTTCKDSDECN